MMFIFIFSSRDTFWGKCTIERSFFSLLNSFSMRRKNAAQNLNKNGKNCYLTLRKVLPAIYLQNNQIPTTTQIMYLGLILDKRLSWGPYLKQKERLLTLDFIFYALFSSPSSRSITNYMNKQINAKFHMGLRHPNWGGVPILPKYVPSRLFQSISIG